MYIGHKCIFIFNLISTLCKGIKLFSYKTKHVNYLDKSLWRLSIYNTCVRYICVVNSNGYCGRNVRNGFAG